MQRPISWESYSLLFLAFSALVSGLIQKYISGLLTLKVVEMSG